MGQINLGTMLVQSTYGSRQAINQGNKGITSRIGDFDKTFSYAKQNVQNNRTERDYRQDSNKVQDSSKCQNQETVNKDSSSIRKEEPIKKNEQTSDSKEVSKESSINSESEQTVEEMDSNIVDEQILALISQTLNMPIEEVKSLLGQLGLGVQDLLSQEGFSTFISQALGKGNMEMLLTDSDDLSMVTQLFEELTALNETVTIEHAAIQDSIATQNSNLQQVIDHKTVQNESNVSLNTLETMQEAESIDTVQTSNVGTIKTDIKSNLNEETEGHLSFLQGNETPTEDVGEQIPVHHFTSTQLMQSIETESGTVMRTVTAKVNSSGETFIEQIDFKAIGQAKELNMQLSPKELGQLNIKIVEHNGTLVAEIKVDNEKAKALILSEIHLLKDNLEGEGLNVSDVKVDIRQDQHQSQMEQERQKSSKRIQEIISKHFSEVNEDQEESPIPVIMDSEVDYMV